MTDLQRPPPEASDDRGASADASQADKPVGELLADVTANASALLRKEVEMAVVELKDEARQAARAGGMLSAGALSGYFSLLFASFGVAWLVDRKLPRPAAFFLVAGLHGATAAALLSRGRQQMKQVDPVPKQTIETVKDTVEWAKAPTG